MGVIDKTWVKLTCNKCGATETSSAVQKGSAYNIGSWSDLSPFSKFQATTKRGEDGPEVTAATCNKCKAPAKVEAGFSPP